jgi:hypothetical protein
MSDANTTPRRRWLGPGVAGIGTATLGAPAAALGLVEGLAGGLAGGARLAGGAIADDPCRRRTVAVGGYATTAVLSGLLGAATSVWQVAILRAGAWAARGLRPVRRRPRDRLVGLGRLYPAAHPDRVAALTPLALVGNRLAPVLLFWSSFSPYRRRVGTTLPDERVVEGRRIERDLP